MTLLVLAQYYPPPSQPPSFLNSLFVSLIVALASAVIGFFWFLAYKHPKSFKAVSAPFMFIFGMAVLLALTFVFSASLISNKIGMVALDDSFPIKDYEVRERVVRMFAARISPYQHIAFYVAGVAAIGIVFLIFFSWVSGVIQKERAPDTSGRAPEEKDI